MIAYLFAALVGVAAQTSEPFDFHGIKLGISQQEFLQTKYQGISPTCDTYDERLAQTICNFYRKGQSPGDASADHPFPLGAESLARGVTYWFTKDQAGTPRLYKITFDLSSAYFFDAKTGLTDKWGPPADQKAVSYVGGLGQHFAAGAVYWTRPDSLIALEQVCEGSMYLSCVTYEDTALVQVRDQAILAQEHKATAGKF